MIRNEVLGNHLSSCLECGNGYNWPQDLFLPIIMSRQIARGLLVDTHPDPSLWPLEHSSIRSNILEHPQGRCRLHRADVCARCISCPLSSLVLSIMLSKKPKPFENIAIIDFGSGSFLSLSLTKSSNLANGTKSAVTWVQREPADSGSSGSRGRA